uniref:Complement C3-like n=1 Tax=Scleropages formosus TaxID=113540 RepID=A0A8C9VR72_SCLFO
MNKVQVQVECVGNCVAAAFINSRVFTGDLPENMMASVLCSVILMLLCLGSACLGEPLHLMVAPNILRTDNDQSVYLEAQGYKGNAPVPVTVEVLNFPQKSRVLCTRNVVLDSSTKFQSIVKIRIAKTDFEIDENNPKRNRYVYLQATFNDEHKVQSEILVSFHSSYVFVQTDKPIYNPSENVQYRMFVTNTDAKSVDSTVTVQIKNSEGIVVNGEPRMKVENGMLSKTYTLPDVLEKEGTWTIEVQLPKHPENLFSTQFDVKKHVLPTFAVTLTPRNKFFHVTEKELNVDIEARYLFDNEVQGNVYVLFGVLRKNGMRENFQSTLKRETLKDGKALATLKREDIKPAVDELLGDSIYIRAQVITSTGSDIVDAEATVKVVKSPYRILFPKSSRYFKPGFPFSLYTKVILSDGSPAEQVRLKCDGMDVVVNTNKRGVAVFSVNTNEAEQKKLVTIKTAVSDMPDSYQTEEQITLYAFQKKLAKEYLHLSFGETSAKPDGHIQITISFNEQQLMAEYVSYMVVSRGQIIKANKWSVTGSRQIKEMLEVSRDMIPSFRLVAFYTVSNHNEVISDSLWVDVEDMCQGKLELSIHRQRPEYTPKATVKLRVKGDPGALVGLGIVDKAALTLSNKGILTQAKIWDTIEDQDIGCTRGGGKDNMGIFTDAGLVFASSAGEKTMPRQSHTCSSNDALQRKHRSATLTEMKLELENRYNDNLLKKCCHDGMIEFPLEYSCEKRSSYISESHECVEVFLHCCHDIQNKKKHYNVQELSLSRTSESDFDESSIYVRSKFEVSWMWKTISLNENIGPDGLVTYQEDVPLKDSITQWKIMAISASLSKGVCVADPMYITVKKRFFVDLRLPYSVVNKEQVNIKAVLHNYYEENIKFTVELLRNEFVCSEASTSGKTQKTVDVPSYSSSLVQFTVIPLKVGLHSIKVRAFNREYEAGDAIEKLLLVAAEGVETFKKTVKILNPSIKGGIQREEFSLPSLERIVPGLDPTSYITVLGDELADTLENSLSGHVLSKLIKMPGGCVEQNLASMASPVIATHYLDSSNAWESVGVQKREEALSYIRKGYEKQLQYRNSDDSYPPYGGLYPSTWVTAYTAKVFAVAYPFGHVDGNRVCRPIAFLIQHKQTPNGYFEKGASVYDSTLMGGAKDEEAPGLTAFVLIAMKEAQQICDQGVPNIHSSMSKASDYLLNLLPGLSSPYILAIASYALGLYGTPKETLMNYLKKADSSDEFNKPTVIESLIEAKGYILLALLKLDELEMAASVSQWLMEKASAQGQFGSTQSTMVVFQALAQYKLQEPRKPAKNLNVKLSIKGRSRPVQWTFTRNTWFASRSEKVHKLTNFILEAEGSGTGKIVFLTVYNAIPKQEESCESYEMDVQIKPVPRADVQDKYGISVAQDTNIYELKICLRLLPGTPETMTILDVSIPSGFVPSWTELEMLKKRVDKLIDYYSFDEELSSKGSLIIHLYKMPRDFQHCVPVLLFQEYIVGLLQPSTVTAYSYYNKEKNCTKLYHPAGNSTQLSTICIGDVCKCAEKSCPSVNIQRIDIQQPAVQPNMFIR